MLRTQLVRHHTARDTEEPREGLARHLFKSTPRDDTY